ncbi:MAG: hypothetical protein CMJ78_18065 [Planctomycetaceae bacterium]|nr:hypothetical protein [Planctomycetaceae bacterium]
MLLGATALFSLSATAFAGGVEPRPIMKQSVPINATTTIPPPTIAGIGIDKPPDDPDEPRDLET